jgi:hypothetical protein
MTDGRDVALIGVDGGATEAKAHAVDCPGLQPAGPFTLREEAASRKYEPLAGFEPVPVQEQIASRDNPQLTDQERTLGDHWTSATADAISEIAEKLNANSVLVGVGMPGLKTADGRGINAINNGPRIPNYLDLVEEKLRAAGLALHAPIAALGSDADYCGLGEQYADKGLFRDVADAYYFGGGTGIADALKLNNELVPFDACKSWLQKSWQMPSALGPTYEKLISAKSLNAVAAALSDSTAERFPEHDAQAGVPQAVTWMRMAATVLANLLFERLWTVKHGRHALPHRGDAYAALETDHPYRGRALERLIIGQRIGQIYGGGTHAATFKRHVDEVLARLIAESEDKALAENYLTESGTLQPGFVVASNLRAAPAIGAAVAAVRALG